MLKLNAVGDVSLCGKIENIIKEGSINEIFEGVRGELNDSDILTGNFEFPFTKKANPFHFYSRKNLICKPEYSEALEGIKWSVLSLANNHIMDWGIEGINTTKEILYFYCDHLIGAGKNEKEARSWCLIKCNEIHVAFIAYAKRSFPAINDKPGSNLLKKDRIIEDIRLLKSKVDHIIIHLHWGIEYCSFPSPEDVKLAHSLIDEGASLIIGHHPHTLQGIDRYKHGLIAYSLGNFIFDLYLDKPPRRDAWEMGFWSGILSVNFGKKSIDSYEFIPTIIKPEFKVELAKSKDKEKINHHINCISNQINSKKFYETAISNVSDRAVKKWKEIIKKEGLYGIFTFVKSIRYRHLKMFIMNFFYNRIKKDNN